MTHSSHASGQWMIGHQQTGHILSSTIFHNVEEMQDNQAQVVPQEDAETHQQMPFIPANMHAHFPGVCWDSSRLDEYARLWEMRHHPTRNYQGVEFQVHPSEECLSRKIGMESTFNSQQSTMTEVPDIANVVTINYDESALSPSSCNSPVYEELQTSCQNYEGMQGKMNDQGYESGGSCSPEHQFHSLSSSPILPTTYTDYSENVYNDVEFINAYMPPTNNPLENFEQGWIKNEPIEWVDDWPNGQQATTMIDMFSDLTEPYIPYNDEQQYTGTANHVPMDQHAQFEPVLVQHQPLGKWISDPDNDSDYAGSESNDTVVNATPPKKPDLTLRRRRKYSKQPILWRFLLNALNEPEKYGKMIHWVNKEEGVFQFTSHHKEELSKEWGEAKRNRCQMTYQKMARALRNYINRGEVLRKVKKKLQYTFLPEFYKNILAETAPVLC